VKPWRLGICIAAASAYALAQNAEKSTELLFAKSDLAGALRTSAAELKHSPHDVNAQFVRMEAARLELRNRDVLHSAIAVLKETRGNDPRARIAAARIRELAANTPQFRAVLPEIAELLAKNTPQAITLSGAVLSAAADGTVLPGRLRLARRVTKWQIAGPFGQFSEVDFDRVWPPEENELRSARYGKQIREDIEVQSGELQLPEYLTHSGVYYAAGQISIPHSDQYRLTVESDGTYQLNVDGIPLLVHDARFSQQNAASVVEAEFSPGKHLVFLKLQASALPLRIWIEPVRKVHSVPLKLLAWEELYVNAATALMGGDPRPALKFNDQDSSVIAALKAEAVSQTGDERRAIELFRSLSNSDSRNLLSAFKVAETALGSEQYEEATAELGRVLKGAPAYPQTQELKFQLAEHFNWQTEQDTSLSQRLRLHPSCSALIDAIRFYEAHSQSDRAQRYEAMLATCSPRPYEFWEHLSLRGKHKLAGNSIRKYLGERPDDRQALIMAIREAVLANDVPAAGLYGKALHTLAPNWRWAAALADHPELILDSRSGYSAANDFYKPFVRDPFPWMRESDTQLSDNRVLINDRVVKLDSRGAWIYQHSVTQALNKRGIAQLGEVDIPRAVDLLELRTLKANGTFVEAEEGENKNIVSMPSLAEGDAIEIAYLQHVSSETLITSPEVLDFAFASSQSPTRSARLTLIRDHVPEPLLWRSPEVPCIHSEPGDDVSVTIWEIANRPAVQDEPAAPKYDRRARLLWLSMDRTQLEDPRAQIRNALISATKVSFRIRDLASELEGSSGSKINAAYQYVMQNIEEEPENWHDGNITSADESLEHGEGNRAATLVALLSALGYEADLVLASERGKHDADDKCTNARSYTHPLVRVALPDSGTILVDPQVDGVAAGALSPEVEGETALIIPRSQAPSKQSFVVAESTNQLSVATAALRLDEAGGLAGKMRIRFGSFRSAQMRKMLRSLPSRDRETFFEQMANRILPSASSVAATVNHEEDPEQALELELNIRASKFGQWNGSEVQLEEIVPPLRLGKIYATLPQRHQPVFLDTPLIESSEFAIDLPAVLAAVRVSGAFDVKSEFVDYHSEFISEGRVRKLSRRFRIPSQVIAPAKYREFSDFALQVDTAEKQPIQLRRTVLVQMLPDPAQGAHSPQPLH